MQVSFELRISSDKKGTKLKNEKYENYRMRKFLKTEAQLSTMKTEKKYDNMKTKKYENYRMRTLLNPPPKLVYL